MSMFYRNTENLSARQLYEKGMDAYEQKNYKEAVRIFRTASKLGDTDAQYMMVHMYYHGYGVFENHNAATSWFLYSAKNGNADAQSYLRKLGIWK